MVTALAGHDAIGVPEQLRIDELAPLEHLPVA